MACFVGVISEFKGVSRHLAVFYIVAFRIGAVINLRGHPAIILAYGHGLHLAERCRGSLKFPFSCERIVLHVLPAGNGGHIGARGVNGIHRNGSLGAKHPYIYTKDILRVKVFYIYHRLDVYSHFSRGRSNEGPTVIHGS